MKVNERVRDVAQRASGGLAHARVLVLEQSEELRDRRLHLASARLVVAAAIASGKARIGDMSKEKPEEDKKRKNSKI